MSVNTLGHKEHMYAGRRHINRTSQLTDHHLPASAGLSHPVPSTGHGCLIAQAADEAVATPVVLAHAFGTAVRVQGTLVDVCSRGRVSAATPAHRGTSRNQGPPGPELQPRRCPTSLTFRVSQYCGCLGPDHSLLGWGGGSCAQGMHNAPGQLPWPPPRRCQQHPPWHFCRDCQMHLGGRNVPTLELPGHWAAAA